MHQISEGSQGIMKDGGFLVVGKYPVLFEEDVDTGMAFPLFAFMREGKPAIRSWSSTRSYSVIGLA